MTETLCTGLDGANPLHMLASLGLLRLADRIERGARLGWRMEAGAWRPVLRTVLDREPLLERMVEWTRALAQRGNPDPALESRVRALNAEVNNLLKQAKEDRRKAANEAKQKGLKGREAEEFISRVMAAQTQRMAAKKTELLRAREAVAGANGVGIAHWGEVIGVQPEIVRRAGVEAIDAWLASTPTSSTTTPDPVMIIGHLPALACDQISENEKVKPTPFSFGNGAGNQYLLKDFCACAMEVTAERLCATLEGRLERIVLGLTGLNWEPADQRSYALAWIDPANTDKAVDVAANALAYIGLSLLPSMPASRGLAAIGWGQNNDWTWPIWHPFLGHPCALSLLAHHELARSNPNRSNLVRMGVAEVFRSRRITVNKRYYFAPSQPV